MFDDWYTRTDKGYAHNLLGIYERLLIGVEVRSILEVGILAGESIRMWASTFPSANVVGIDIIEASSLDSEFSNVKTFKQDAYTAEMVNLLANEGPFDFIVEDGSHILRHQCFVAEHYASLLSEGGVMVIEDISSIEEAHFIQHFIPSEFLNYSYILDRRGAPCDYPYERFDARNEIMVVVDRRVS